MSQLGNILRELADLADNGCGIRANELERISKSLATTESDIEDLKGIVGMLNHKINKLEHKDHPAKIIDINERKK